MLTSLSPYTLYQNEPLILINYHQMEANLNIHHIIQAFTVIQTERANSQTIKMANDFLNQCQNHPAFPSTLLMMYSNATNYQLQMSCLILLTNVIKRNWNFKIRSIDKEIKEQVRQQLRKNILSAYHLHNMSHYKHFNALIAYLARINYPKHYIQLHQFIITSLTQLTELIRNDLENILKNNKALAVLSTCKVVLKQYNAKRITHNKQIFLQCITQIIQIGFNTSQLLVQKIKDHFERGSIQALGSLFQFLKKIDKVLLYALGSMPSEFQYKPQVKNIIHIFVSKIQQFDILFTHMLNQSALDVCQQIQKYFTGIIQQLTRLQNSYPFLYSDILKEYLLIIVKLLIQNVPKSNFYQTQKILSAIICANSRPLLLFAYFAKNHQYSKSIYVRKHGSAQNLQIQQNCHKIFKEIYSNDAVIQLLKVLITEVMTAAHVLKDHKEFSDDFILEDRQFAIMDAPSQLTVYQNCIELSKAIIKCFKQQSFPVIISMLQKVQQLKYCNDQYSQQILVNILQIIIMIPTIYDIDYLPVDKICGVISAVYEARQFSCLSRLIRKYHEALPLETSKKCFEILANIVATPVNASLSYQIIYQCAIGLKTLTKQMHSESIPLEILTACISNMVSLVNMKQFISCPTLMWPIVNLLIKFVQVIDNLNCSSIAEETAKIIINGLSSLICSQKNQQLLVSALAELISMLLFCCFRPLKLYYRSRNQYNNEGMTLNQKICNIGKQTFIVFDAGVTFIQCNIHHAVTQDIKGTINRFWLTMLRTYPTIYEQQLYGIHLEVSNQKLSNLFRNRSQELMEYNPMFFIQLVEEYFITELIDIDTNQLANIMFNTLQLASVEGRTRILIALASLYYSFSLIKTPQTDTLIFFVKEIINFHNQITPEINSFRTLVFLILNQNFLNNSASDFYNLFTNAIGTFQSWFLPYICGMHFVSNKFAYKLNATVLLKSISDVGPSHYSKLLLSSLNNQVALDHFLKVMSIQLGILNIDSVISSYYNIFRLLSKQLTPQFQTTIYRKTRLHFSDKKLTAVATLDLSPNISTDLKQVLRLLSINASNLVEIIGQRSAMELNVDLA